MEYYIAISFFVALFLCVSRIIFAIVLSPANLGDKAMLIAICCAIAIVGSVLINYVTTRY